MVIFRGGRVTIAFGAGTVFDLAPEGNLEIDRSLGRGE